MKLTAVVCVLSLLLGGVALVPTSAQGAPWISDAESSMTPWVKTIKQELLKNDYWMIYANDPRIPKKEVLGLLNRAAKTQEVNDPVLAQALVREALGVFEEGVRRHYYSHTDIEPLISYIRQHVPIPIS